MNNESVKLGENLKKLRIDKGISQGDIARFLAVDKSYISNIENGKANPTLSTITKLAKALNTKVEILLK